MDISRPAGSFITCYTVLTRPSKVETAVHGCKSWLSLWALSCRCCVKLSTSYQPCIIVYCFPPFSTHPSLLPPLPSLLPIPSLLLPSLPPHPLSTSPCLLPLSTSLPSLLSPPLSSFPLSTSPPFSTSPSLLPLSTSLSYLLSPIYFPPLYFSPLYFLSPVYSSLYISHLATPPPPLLPLFQRPVIPFSS